MSVERAADALEPAPDFVAAAYAAHQPALWRRLSAQTRDAALAEDLVHEAFIRLAAEVAAGRRPDNVGAWLQRVASNLLVSGARRASVAERRRGELARPQSPATPEAVALAAEEAAAVRMALDRLHASDREALVLAANGYRGAEIASRLGRSEGATRTLLCRARTRMRAQLAACGMLS